MRSSRRCARDIDPPRYQAGRGYHGLLPSAAGELVLANSPRLTMNQGSKISVNRTKNPGQVVENADSERNPDGPKPVQLRPPIVD
jgi:hypothetical protein